MEFIKRMQKREFFEMTLKALCALMALFVAIILMEGMIYGIKLKEMKKNSANAFYSNESIAYCIEQNNDEYLVLFYTEGLKNTKGDVLEWTASSEMTKQQCEKLKTQVKEVHMHAPSAFTFSMSTVHYVIISVITAGLIGFLTWRYVLLAKQYTKIKKQYQNNGFIEIN